jgi:protocatechuate 3,4-dioxygenase beta subunit
MMHDDLLVGRLLSRRRAMALLGSTGAAWMTRSWAAVDTAAAAGSCVARPEQTEGPYFVDEQLNRSDIRSDPTDGSVKSGAPLSLSLLVTRLDGRSCRPLAGATVDIWHCDAQGIYSGVKDWSFDTAGRKFLRGYQVTGEDGAARFLTIYPGAYRGRTVHIHFKIRTPQARSRNHEFTSQLYFDDAMTQRLLADAPYSSGKARLTANQDDGIFRRGGQQLMLQPVSGANGHSASFGVALDF